MQAKKKTCSRCCKQRHIWKNHEGERYCKPCWHRRQTFETGNKNQKSQPKPRSRSPRRSTQETEYSKIRKSFLANNPVCQVRVPGICVTASTDVHHKKGRSGILLTDDRYFLSTCRPCHDWVETHPIEAKDLGFSDNRN